jgi:acyl carrier protein
VLEQLQRNGLLHVTAASGMAALEKIILSDRKNVAFLPGSQNAQVIAANINSLRQSFMSKPKVVVPAKPRQMENQIMSTTKHLKEHLAIGDSQMQLLMGEFEKQRDMLMRLYENQNALLVNALSGASIAAMPEATHYQSAPSLSAPPASVQMAVSTPEPLREIQEAVHPAPALSQPARVTPISSVVVATPEPTPQPAMKSEPSPVSVAPASLFEYVRSLMAKAVGTQETDIDPDQNIMELGADSMTAMSMVKELEQRYSIELPATLLFEYATLNELVDFLKTEIGGKAA